MSANPGRTRTLAIGNANVPAGVQANVMRRLALRAETARSPAKQRMVHRRRDNWGGWHAAQRAGSDSVLSGKAGTEAISGMLAQFKLPR